MGWVDAYERGGQYSYFFLKFWILATLLMTPGFTLRWVFSEQIAIADEDELYFRTRAGNKKGKAADVDWKYCCIRILES